MESTNAPSGNIPLTNLQSASVTDDEVAARANANVIPEPVLFSQATDAQVTTPTSTDNLQQNDSLSPQQMQNIQSTIPQSHGFINPNPTIHNNTNNTHTYDYYSNLHNHICVHLYLH